MPSPAPTRWIVPQHTLVDDHGNEITVRRCTECRSWLPADTEHFYRSRERLAGTCKPCKRDQTNQNRAFALSHPESRADYLARAERSRRRWRERHPEQHREITRAAHRRRYRRRRQEYAELARIHTRLKAELEGRALGHGRPATVAPYRLDAGKHGYPLEPLQAWLEAVLEREAPESGSGGRDADRIGHDIEAVAHSLGVDTRAIWRIQHAEHKTVSLAVADRLLTNYGRPVVIRSRDLEARLVAWAHELPGNGTRLLRYLDRAEAVAHLADVSLMSLGDLWPELDA